MPNFDTHFFAGGIVSVLANSTFKKNRQQQISLGEMIVSFITGGAVASLPDMIDPATGPNHRSVGHSLTFSSLGFSRLNDLIIKNPSWNIEEKEFLLALLPAYASHLALDSTTPSGLPLFG